MNTRCSTLLTFTKFLLVCVSPVVSQVPQRQSFDIEAVLGYTLEHSFAIRQARARVREQDGIATTVAAAGLPLVSANVSLQHSSTQTVSSSSAGPVFFLPSGRFWRMNLVARQEIFAGGGIAAARRAENITTEAVIAGLREIVARALLDVRLKFYNVLLAKEQIAVEEKNIEVLRRQLVDATNRFEVGSVSTFERVRAEVAVANAQPALITARNKHRLAIEELRQAMGSDPSESKDVAIEVVGALQVEPYSIDLNSALAAARLNRPELVRLAKLNEAAKDRRFVARAGYLPRVALTAGSELRTGSTERFIDSRDGLRAGIEGRWSVAPRVTKGRVIQAESIEAQSVLTLEEAGLKIAVDVRRAFALMDQANELVVATAKTSEQAEEALRTAEVRQGAGLTTQLEVLQAQAALSTARTNQLRAVHAFNSAGAQLRWSIGVSELIVSSSSLPTDIDPQR